MQTTLGGEVARDDARVARDLTNDTALDQPTPRPTAHSARLAGIDIARALALIGMFTQHVVLSDSNGDPPTGWIGWFFREAAGRASVLFFVLSGVSLSVIARRGSRSAAPPVLRRRGLLLLLGGILLTITVWGGSILQHYGLAFLLAPWLLRLGRRGLVVVTATGLIGGPIAMLWLPTLSDEVTGAWSGPTGSWLIGQSWDLLVGGTYPMVIWIGFFTLGMLIGRLDLRALRVRRTLALGGIAATVAFGGLSNITADAIALDEPTSADIVAEAPVADPDLDLPAGERLTDPFEALTDDELQALSDDEFDALVKQSDQFYDQEPALAKSGGDISDTADWRSLTDTSGHSGKHGWTLQTSAIAMAILGLCLLLPRRASTLLYPLAALGSMSLTAYLVHIALVNDVWDAHVAEQSWSIVTQEFAFLGLVTAMTASCVAFHRLWKAGPFERLLKHFTLRSPEPGAE